MNRRVIFVPDDYWTNPPKEKAMTNPIAGDHRRATALVCHFGRLNTPGMNAILEEAATENRVSPLIVAVLALHEQVIPLLLTRDGLACLTGAIYTLTDDPNHSDDTHRAARLVVADSEANLDAVNGVLQEAAAANRVTELVVSIMSMFSTLVAVLYSEVGLQVLERSVIDWAAREENDQ